MKRSFGKRAALCRACLCLVLLLAVETVAQTFLKDVTEEAFDAELIPARSTAFGDYDNDGWTDMFLAENWHTGGQRTALLHNKGGGRFELHNDFIQAEMPGRKGGGPVFGDYDNDGDQDLFVPIGSWTSGTRAPNALLRNDRGVFTDVAQAAGMSEVLSTDTAIWLDYDRDGYLDLYTGNLGAPDIRNILYRNNGDGTFSDATAAAGLDVQFHAFNGGTNGGMVAGDFDDDGWPDLYVAAFAASNRLFLNDGGGAFTEATTSEIADTTGQAFGVAAGDIDNDGDLDLFQISGFTAAFRSSLYQNLGGGKFLDITAGVGLVDFTSHLDIGIALTDIDNDGDLDLAAVGVERGFDSRTRFLFLNDGEGFFADHSVASGIGEAALSAAVADVDRDGLVDVQFSLSNLPYSSFGSLYRNQGMSQAAIGAVVEPHGNHYLRVELVGVQSNRDAIGARVVATAGTLRQTRQILGGVGFNQDERVAHFGLGAQTQVDELEIRWPSGEVDVLRDIPADRQIRVIEGRQEYHVVQPMLWESNLPDALVVGSALDLEIEVQPALFEPDAVVTNVSADLSSLSGPSDVEFVAGGDGSYSLERTLVVEGINEIKTVSIFVEQSTSLGPYWSRLSRTIKVLPQDEVIFDEELAPSWQAGAEEGFGDRQELFQGRQALAFSSTGESYYRPVQPLSPVGYRALRFSFHPGDAVLDRSVSRLAFYGWDGEDFEVFAIRADGSEPINLTDNDRGDLFQWGDQLAWSPDGEKIAFTSQRDENNEIYVMNADGSDQVRLTSTDPEVLDSNPAWSPDGKQIFFSSSRDNPNAADIYAMDADGSNVVRLTDPPALDGIQSLSPDGTQIAFVSNRDANFEIYVMAVDGSNPVRLTDTPATDWSPHWSPDGTRIVFQTNRDGNDEIYVMNADGSNPVNLTNHPGVDQWPAWSPDGTQISFNSNREGQDEIYAMNADGTHPIRLTNNQNADFGASWWPLSAPVAVDLGVALNGGEVIQLLLDVRGFGPDLERGQWQEVEIPLEAFGDFGETIESVDFIGHLSGAFYLDDIHLVPEDVPTSVQEVRETVLPQSFALDQNYPNPFNSNTVIRFALPQDGLVELAIYNTVGQKVATLVQGMRAFGTYTVNWDGRDEGGRELASGVYLYRLMAGTQVATRKLLVLH